MFGLNIKIVWCLCLYAYVFFVQGVLIKLSLEQNRVMLICQSHLAALPSVYALQSLWLFFLTTFGKKNMSYRFDESKFLNFVLCLYI